MARALVLPHHSTVAGHGQTREASRLRLRCPRLPTSVGCPGRPDLVSRYAGRHVWFLMSICCVVSGYLVNSSADARASMASVLPMAPPATSTSPVASRVMILVFRKPIVGVGGSQTSFGGGS